MWGVAASSNDNRTDASPRCDDLVARIHDAPWRAVLAVTGGGSGAFERLLAVPGASRTVLEAVVPYAETALADWLGGAPDQACTEAASRRMAMASFERARRLAPGDDPRRLVGVGATAALVTDRPKRGEHRVHVAAQTAERTLCLTLRLEKGRRGRAEEEAIAAQAVIATLADAAGVRAIDLSKGPPSLEATMRSRTAPAEWTELLLGERAAVAIGGAAEQPALLLPGSFNPLHEGHRGIMRFAERRLGGAGAFELSISNVDKPRLDFLELEERVAGLDGLPLLLTDAPTFVAKAERSPGCVFAVGADTAVRIGDAAYYGGDVSACDTAIDRLAELGCRFLVFGRLLAPGFRVLDDLRLPPALAALCEGIPGEDFRADVSSTALRNGV